jgi:subfamily B ATP-binding cassette protein MsbA
MPLLRPHRKALGGALAALLVSAGIGLAFPLVVRYLMDAAFVERSIQLLGRIALGLTGLFAIQGFLNFIEAYLLSATGERVVARLRTDLFSHLLELEPGFFADRASGELASRLAADCSTLQGVLSHQSAELLRQIIYLIGALTLLTLLHWQLMVTTLGVAPIVVLLAVAFGRYLRGKSTIVQDKLAEAQATAEEALGQIPVVQSFVREPWEADRYAERIGESLNAALKRALARGLFFGVLTFVAFGGIVVVLWQGGRLVITAEISAGQLVSFLLYAFQVAAAITALASLWSSYQIAQGAARRVFELLDTTPTIHDPDQPETAPYREPGAIAFRDVSFRYGEEDPWALHELNVVIPPGEVVALVGTVGQVLVHGHDARGLRLEDLRNSIGLVPQDHHLFAGSITENIRYGQPGASTEEVRAAARAAHAEEFIERLPSGYDTLVGERGVKLSGGQRQRLAIARVILKSPRILVLDEATSSLDTESERHVEAALEAVMRERTTIIIAHRLRTVRRADRLLVLDRGRLVEEGTHDTLLAQAGLYARLYSGQRLDLGAGGEAGLVLEPTV